MYVEMWIHDTSILLDRQSLLSDVQEGDDGSQWGGREDSYSDDSQDRDYFVSPADQRFPAQYDDRQGPVNGEPYPDDDDSNESGSPTTWGSAANYESVEDW